MICLTVTVKGTDIQVDFSNTSPQVNWGVNVVYNFTYAYVFMAIKSVFRSGSSHQRRRHPTHQDDGT